MDKVALEYLAQRLEAVAMGRFCEAATLVRQVIASTSQALALHQEIGVAHTQASRQCQAATL
ncbi:hypothetical protein [Pseudomonas sp. DSV-1]|uniref:hypothetical protein n=1 Tax=Pseudomonas sp. DSV-1 TaxID=3112250 RepID=UPI002DBDD387|nr:hypothetical protein [Pseudomonas sp. DSV-1]MEC4242062.1 hypothetical protein [Pseudomonas sp. DSV-1]